MTSSESTTCHDKYYKEERVTGILILLTVKSTSGPLDFICVKEDLHRREKSVPVLSFQEIVNST